MKIAPSSDESSAGKPRLSVVMPVWNGSRFVGEAVESILAQDFRDFELIIVDDASTDSTPEILAWWAARDGRIRVIRNESNLGSPASRNRGIEIARGEYVACHDADDLSLPGRFAVEVGLLDEDPGASMVTMNYQFIDEAGSVLRTEKRNEPPEIAAFLLTFTNPIGGHSQVMFRRDAFVQAGGYDESHRFGEDPELWTRLSAIGRVVMLPEVGMRYRLHAQQKTAVFPSEQRRTRAAERARRLFSAYLDREVPEEQVRALTRTWHGHPAGPDVQTADRLLREAFQVFASRHASRSLRRRFRRVTANRLALVTLIALRDGRPGAAVRLLPTALGWAPGPALVALMRYPADAIATAFRRRGARRRR